MLRQVSSVIGKQIFLCLLSASLLILSFPNFNIEFLAWFGFVPLFFTLQNKSKLKAFLLAYITGIIFWLGTIYWLIHVTLPGMLILVLYLALYFGVFGLSVSIAKHRAPSTEILFIPSLWVLLEYLRSHLFTGFPWALLGYSQYLNLPVIQIADITGVWGVSFLVMAVNVWIYSVIGYRLSVIGEKPKYLLPILCIFIILSHGYYKIQRTPSTEHRAPLKISVIQGNIPQELKWNPVSRDFIIEKYLNLTSQAAKDKSDLIIWPEAALPVVLQEEPLYYEKARAVAQRIKTPLLLGAVTWRDRRYYNSALLISSEGSLLSRYDKLHLVPFGEYVPLRKVFSFLETIVPIGDFTPGKEYVVFPLTLDPPPKGERVGARGRFSVLICFEDLFPELSRNFAKRGADFLVNITNDAWFKNTSSPYQHLAASVFRAVENRVYLVRAANTGVSGFIGPSGRIISLVEDATGKNIFVDGYKTEEISVGEKKLSFYTRYGDVFILLCVSFTVVLWFLVRRRIRKFLAHWFNLSLRGFTRSEGG